ncbi:CSLREA domain-containing protein [Tahibacter amnicola]|uniref:CSLREA domain-containing protein n=1 Tax=Tahibacter amnicola TaxID=2976241 RepID=A0ABY6BJP6_9GAMM|nr:CSLREA domain-containing protein [Tahibacter amnicola]UXI70236.1 CSLREA domain-containing protein [Tahibacter amnicola]
MLLRVFSGCLLTIAVTTPATAATWLVNTTQDAPDAQPGDGQCATAAGHCTLRAAIQEANATPGYDTLRVPGGFYFPDLQGAPPDDTAQAGDLDIREPLLFRGEPDDKPVQIGDSTLHSAEGERVFDIDTGDASMPVRFEHITIQFGKSHDELGGGAAVVRAGSVVEFDRSVLYANGADRRGNALAVYGRATLIHSHVFDNHRSWNWIVGEGGGAIYVGIGGALRLFEVGVDSNNHCFGGGILAHGPSTIQIERSSIRQNRGGNLGCVDNSARGDLLALLGPVQMDVSDSTLGDAREVLYATDGAQVRFTHVTAYGEAATGHFALVGETTRLRIANSVIGRPSWPEFCVAPAGAIVSLGGNVIEQPAPCGIMPLATDRLVSAFGLTSFDIDELGPGLAIDVRRLYAPSAASSPVVDAGLAAHCTGSDAFGSSRPVAGSSGQPARCDAGAVEWPPTHLHRDGFE